MTDALDAIIAASRGWDGNSPDGRILSTTRAFLTAASRDHELLRRAATSLNSLERGTAAWLAVACGTVVESGAPAEVSGAALLDHFRAWLPDLPATVDEESGATDRTPEQQRLLKLFQYLCQSTVTHLARLPEQREAMGQDATLLERLSDLGGWSYGALWVREALTKSSDTVVLLHVDSRSGLRLRYSNVANCFHLFSLLQTAVGGSLPGGRDPDETIAWVARGKRSDAVQDDAWWHYGSPLVPRADLSASIWGEGLTREIPRIDGQQVMLLWPPLLKSRTWGTGFLQPHLDAMPADAAVESSLPPAEAESLLDRIGVSGATKKGWRFW